MAVLVLLALSFALLTVLARYLGTGFTVAQQVYLRSAVAFAIGACALSRSIRWRVVLRVSLREWGVIAVRMALMYMIGTVLYSKAATLAPVGDVSFIAALPFVSAFGLMLRRVRVTGTRMLYVLGSAAGAALLSLSGGGLTSLSSVGQGDLLALIAMFALAVGYIGRPWHDGTLNNAEITELTVGAGAVCVALLSLAHGEGLPRLETDGSMLPWIAVIVGGALNVLNLFLINYAFEHVDPVRAGNLLTLESVWGLVFGLAFFGQVPSLWELAGGAVIVGCAVGLNSARDPDESEPSALRPARARPRPHPPEPVSSRRK
ncbi:DMT family transporter [Actinospica robiniae]|uniref:DMT family transporter n=1 Tax=Actinospica robiniae TaxID=304901 RepID=UPI00041D5E61|nr:DMT family transporter [Actinospica robiniae]